MFLRTASAIAALPLLVAALQLPAAPDGARRMTYRWSPRQVTKYRVAADLSGSLPIMQSVEPIELDATLDLVYKVIVRSVDATGAASVDFRVQSAEAELARIPLPVPFEDAQRVLDRSVTFAPTGEVRAVKAAGPLPFALSIPGVDPQRLYTLVCPIVFPERPVKRGDTWEYRSELLGTEGQPARFTATVIEPDPVKPGSRSERALRVRQDFTMNVDQRLAADKKPVESDGAAHATRTGTIKGSGVMAFSPDRGKLLRGHLTIQADITERIVGEPAAGETPETISKVKAVVRITPVVAPPAKQ
ncbi:MAG: hypothetical protein FJX72_14835 [Armatimonadetes bacterium]|nr:hypothetical protein [Armatimonadota bacterium]